MTNVVHNTQTAWLTAARDNVAGLLTKLDDGTLDLQTVYAATVAPGFPAKGSRHKTSHLNVAVYTGEQSPNGKAHLLIDPRLTNPVEAVEAVLYGAAMLATNHLPSASALTGPLMLNDDWSGLTTDLLDILEAMADQLGDYPAAGLQLPKHTPQKGRMIKFACSAPDCGWQAYTSRRQLERMNAHAACPCCGTLGTLHVPAGKA